MKKFFEDYFPKREVLKSKTFRKILFSFFNIVIILSLVFTLYFYNRVYKKELYEFIEDVKRNANFISKISEDSMLNIAERIFLLSKDPLFLESVTAPNLKDKILLFFEKKWKDYHRAILSRVLIVTDKKNKVLFTYNIDKRTELKYGENILRKLNRKVTKKNRNIYFSYSKEDGKNAYFFYYFSSNNRNVYIAIPISNFILFLSQYVNYTHYSNFIYSSSGEPIYKFFPINKHISFMEAQKSILPIQKNISIKKTTRFLVTYIPFKALPFDLSFVYINLIPIYTTFRIKEYVIILLVFFFFTIILGTVFSQVILRQIIVPLQALKETVVKITQGDFRRSVNLSTGDEFEELANAINVMARRLEDLYVNLEKKVRERTEELERQKYRLKKLYELSFIFFKDKDEMLRTLLQGLIDILDVENVSVSHKSSEGWKFLSFVNREKEEIYDTTTVVRDLKLDEVVYNTKKPLIIDDALAYEEWKGYFVETQIRSYMGVPIFVNNEIYGVLSVINSYPYKFLSGDLEIAALFSQRISYFLEAELWEKKIIEKQRELEELNDLLYMKNMELLKLAEDLKRANKAKSDFLANVSHELRTPLNAILGFSEVLLEGYFGKLNKKQEEYIKDILESGQHLLSLINDILDLSKIEAGKEELHLTRVDLKKIIDASLVLIKEKALKHAIRVLVYHDERIKEIVVDELKLKQVLFNLLSNAVKFTPDGGKIGIVTKELDNWYRISVWDTGIGIKKEDVKKLFKEFSQIENPYTKKYKGTGLGLALSRKLIEMHGGFIKVVSVYGKGTTFSLFLPKNLKESIQEDEEEESISN